MHTEVTPLFERTFFHRGITLGEALDFVDCLRRSLYSLDETLDILRDNQPRCCRQCFVQNKRNIKVLKRRRAVLEYRLANIAPQAAHQQEWLEALVMKNAGKL